MILTDCYAEDIHGYEHIAKSLAFDDDGNLYVPFGSPGDVCQVPDCKCAPSGRYPCGELQAHGDIWRFDATATDEYRDDRYRYATGIRSTVAIAWKSFNNELCVVQYGRGSLHKDLADRISRW